MTRRSGFLGFLGPSLVLVGAAAAAVGCWWMVHARSHAADFLDVMALDGETAVAVRAERTSARDFVELRHFDGAVAWQAMVPPYAGRPGAPALAASPQAISVRVVRDGHSEVFGMSVTNAAKLGALKLAASRPASATGATLPAAVTLTDLHFGFELIGEQPAAGAAAGSAGSAWAALVAIDLATGKQRWQQDLGAAPVAAAGVLDGAVWIRQGSAGGVGSALRAFRTVDGTPTQLPAEALPDTDAALADAPMRRISARGARRVEYDRAARVLMVRRGDEVIARHPWPAGAMEPWPYHYAGGRLWIVFADHLESLVLDPVAGGSTLASP
jgi:PQQ enzyme repeat